MRTGTSAARTDANLMGAQVLVGRSAPLMAHNYIGTDPPSAITARIAMYSRSSIGHGPTDR
jgi:hypothetical protein